MPQTAERTIVFADIVGSTAIYDRLGDDAAARWIGNVLATVGAVAGKHSGTVVKYLGDAVLLTFTESAKAIAATSAMHSAAAADGIELYVGVHAGDVVLGDDGDVYGDAVNTAARLYELAAARETLLGDPVPARLPPAELARIRHIDDRVLEGRSAPMAIYQCLAPDMEHSMTSLAQRRPGQLRNRPGKWYLSHGATSLAVPGEPSQITVGRGSACDLMVPVPLASRRHMALSATDRGVTVQDMSTNGTYVRAPGGGERYLHRETVVLAAGATLSLGNAPADTDPGMLMHLEPADAA